MQATVPGERRTLGTFECEEAAALAYDSAARQLHGAAARLNFPPGAQSVGAAAAADAAAPAAAAAAAGEHEASIVATKRSPLRAIDDRSASINAAAAAAADAPTLAAAAAAQPSRAAAVAPAQTGGVAAGGSAGKGSGEGAGITGRGAVSSAEQRGFTAVDLEDPALLLELWEGEDSGSSADSEAAEHIEALMRGGRVDRCWGRELRRAEHIEKLVRGGRVDRYWGRELRRAEHIEKLEHGGRVDRYWGRERRRVDRPSARSLIPLQFDTPDSAEHIEKLVRGGRVDRYWGRELRRVDRPSARSLIPQLAPDNCLGYAPGPAMTKTGSLFEYVLRQKTGSLFEYVLRQKKALNPTKVLLVRMGEFCETHGANSALHPTKVLLVRVGEFFETYGVDSVLLVQWCGLNPMGGKPKAGCPVRNIQQTLDALTQAGLSVAVYEELNDADALGDGGRSGRIKESNDADALGDGGGPRRVLAQVVTPGSPTYYYDACLRTDDVEFAECRPYVGVARGAGGFTMVEFEESRPYVGVARGVGGFTMVKSRPYVGVTRSAGGFTMAEVYADARSARVSERMTEEALRAALEAGGAAEPLLIGVGDEKPPQGGTAGGAAEPLLIGRVRYFGGEEGFVKAVLGRVGSILELAGGESGAFTVARSQRAREAGRPRPVYLSTALQIGLLPNPNVPDLIPRLLPRGYPGHCARFLRRWLLSPPPHALADAMAELCRACARLDTGLPPLRPVSVGKAVALLSAQQCNVPLFRDVDACVRAVLSMLGPGSARLHEGSRSNAYAAMLGPLLALVVSARCTLLSMLGPGAARAHAGARPNAYAAMIGPLLALVGHQSGIDASEERLREGAVAVVSAIAAVIARDDAQGTSVSVDPYGTVPAAFFERNEGAFRGGISASYAPMQGTPVALTLLPCAPYFGTLAPYYAARDAAARAPCDAIRADFPTAATTSTSLFDACCPYYAALDAAVRTLCDAIRADFPTAAADLAYDVTALAAYQDAAAEATAAARAALRGLSTALLAHLPSIVQCAHWAVVAQCAHWVVVAQAAEGHTRHSLTRGWTLPTLLPPDDPSMRMEVTDLRPYWLGARGVANTCALDVTPHLRPYWLGARGVANTFALDGLVLLTAPNMSGKSTLMRATMAAALLAAAGLHVPAAAATVPRYDSFFLRTASFDVPAEGKGIWYNALRLHVPAAAATVPRYDSFFLRTASFDVPAEGKGIWYSALRLHVPAAAATVPHYDSFFLRTASFDVPAEAKSALALEMDDVRVLLRDCTPRSLGRHAAQLRDCTPRSPAMVDELGKGTSAHDGAALGKYDNEK
ncbi:hypothetical protein JKP88DRAFT_308923 [Tribonema minus]|uniref:AP2/ERF domain-containing protein n=1 Tax=Tribonema minus TaxID=303371 RepID=A0A836CI19_9STRA|nr:hypothetical protein JKP88DRAFT_308923 [Tribonema minus]